MGNSENNKIERLREKNERLNKKYKETKEELNSLKDGNSEEYQYLNSLIKDIESTKAEFESLRLEMKNIVQDLKLQKLRYNMLINQTIDLKNEMLNGLKMPFFTKLKYILKNK